MGNKRDDRDTKIPTEPDLDDWESLFGEGEEDDAPLAGLPLPAPPEDDQPQAIKYLGFRLGNERYAVPILDLTEIVNPQEITSVPNVRSFVLGVISVRGRIVPVVDLKQRILFHSDGEEAADHAGLRPGDSPAGRSRLLIAKDEEERMGLLVDAVTQVFLVEPRDIEPPPPTLSRRLAEFVSGIARVDGQMHILLEPRPLLRFDAVASGLGGVQR